MKPRADRPENVAAVQLSGRKEVQRGGEEANPRRASHRWQKQEVGVDARMKQSVEEVQKERRTKNHGVLVRIGLSDRGHDTRMKYPIEKRRDRKNKSNKGTRRPDIEERTGRTNRRAHQDKRPESPDE